MFSSVVAIFAILCQRKNQSNSGGPPRLTAKAIRQGAPLPYAAASTKCFGHLRLHRNLPPPTPRRIGRCIHRRQQSLLIQVAVALPGLELGVAQVLHAYFGQACRLPCRVPAAEDRHIDQRKYRRKKAPLTLLPRGFWGISLRG